MTGTSEQRQSVGHARSQVVNLFWVTTKNAFRDLNQVVQTTSQLHSRNSSDHGSNNQDHVPRHITRGDTEAETENDHASAADVTNTDAA